VTRYTIGADFERKVKKDLESRAWLVVRSAGSRGRADLWAIAPGRTVALIQCKRDAKLSEAERLGLVTEAAAFECIPILAYKDAGVRYLELGEGEPVEWHP
jgi:Holliday junction resolvase